jgi:hypothetical protein
MGLTERGNGNVVAWCYRRMRTSDGFRDATDQMRGLAWLSESFVVDRSCVFIKLFRHISSSLFRPTLAIFDRLQPYPDLVGHLGAHLTFRKMSESFFFFHDASVASHQSQAKPSHCYTSDRALHACIFTKTIQSAFAIPNDGTFVVTASSVIYGHVVQHKTNFGVIFREVSGWK